MICPLFKRGARTPPGHALLGVRACDVHALLGYGLVAWRIIEVVPFFGTELVFSIVEMI